VDKVIGHCILNGPFPLDRYVLLVSGRSSFEIVQKALAARIPIVAAISAPSSLAVKLARESGQTLIGFLRGQSMNIYTHSHRVQFSVQRGQRLAIESVPLDGSPLGWAISGSPELCKSFVRPARLNGTEAGDGLRFIQRNHSRGSTGSLSNASTPNTHSWTRRRGSCRTNRSSDSIPSANSRNARERLAASPRLRNRSRFCGAEYSGP